MTIERIDVGCPGTEVLVNTDNPREFSVTCRCGVLAHQREDVDLRPVAVRYRDEDTTSTWATITETEPTIFFSDE